MKDISDKMVTWKGFGWSAKGFLAAGFAVFSWVDIDHHSRHNFREKGKENMGPDIDMGPDLSKVVEVD